MLFHMPGKDSLIHDIDEVSQKDGFKIPVFAVIAVIVVGLGLFTGLTLAKMKSGGASFLPGGKKAEKTAGIVDKKTFKDSATGILKEGGIDGEGSYHLERPGGVSQNVYLTSSTVDLSSYVGKKVKVWGETFASEKAGWLMDVGLVELQ